MEFFYKTYIWQKSIEGTKIGDVEKQGNEISSLFVKALEDMVQNNIANCDIEKITVKEMHELIISREKDDQQ